MSSKISKLFTILLVVALTAINTVQAAPVWERVATRQAEVIDTQDVSNFDVKVLDGAIILSIATKTPVKVITILGQPVVQQELEAGIWRLPLSTRGIYILKIGSATRRITI